MKQNNIFFRYFSPVAVQKKLYAAALVALLSSSAYEAEAQVGELQMGNQPSKWGTRPTDRP